MNKIQITLTCALSVFVLIGAPACKSNEDAQSQAADEQEAADETDEAAPSEEPPGESGEAEERANAEPGAEETGEGQFPDDLPAGETGTYGGDFTIEDGPMSLAAALDEVEAAGGAQTVKVNARVEKVCKKKGCWFTLTDEEVAEPVRVKMKDYGFFVPRNTDGATAIVEGELTRRTIPKTEAQHYADDEVAGTDQEPRKVEADQDKWEMIITAAEFEMPAGDDTAEN